MQLWVLRLIGEVLRDGKAGALWKSVRHKVAHDNHNAQHKAHRNTWHRRQPQRLGIAN